MVAARGVVHGGVVPSPWPSSLLVPELRGFTLYLFPLGPFIVGKIHHIRQLINQMAAGMLAIA